MEKIFDGLYSYSTAVSHNYSCTFHSMGRELLEQCLEENKNISGEKKITQIVNDLVINYKQNYKNGKFPEWANAQKHPLGSVAYRKGGLIWGSWKEDWIKSCSGTNKYKLNLDCIKTEKDKYRVGNILGQLLREKFAIDKNYNGQKVDIAGNKMLVFDDKIYKPQGSELSWEYQKLTGQPAAVIDLSGKTFSYCNGDKDSQSPLFFGYSDIKDVNKLINLLGEIEKGEGLICVISPGLTMGRCQPVIGENKKKLISKLKERLEALEKQNNKEQAAKSEKNKDKSFAPKVNAEKNNRNGFEFENMDMKDFVGIQKKENKSVFSDYVNLDNESKDANKENSAAKKEIKDLKANKKIKNDLDFEIIENDHVIGLENEESKNLHSESKLDTKEKTSNVFGFEIIGEEGSDDQKNNNVGELKRNSTKKVNPLKLVKQEKANMQAKTKKSLYNRIKSAFKSSKKSKNKGDR